MGLGEWYCGAKRLRVKIEAKQLGVGGRLGRGRLGVKRLVTPSMYKKVTLYNLIDNNTEFNRHTRIDLFKM